MSFMYNQFGCKITLLLSILSIVGTVAFTIPPTGHLPITTTTTATTSSRLYLERPSNSTSSSQRPKNSSTELSASFLSTADVTSSTPSLLKVYCDLDGVLADFDKGVINLLGKPANKVVRGTMWKTIARSNVPFYENLDWTKDGQRLWEQIRHLQPDILTGVPYHKSSRIEKYNWCKQKLGIDCDKLHHVDMASGYRDHESVNGNVPKEDVTNIITCWSNNKSKQCIKRGSVLIDDREDLRQSWEDAGGVFLHHTDTENTIQKLKSHGIL